MSLADQEIAKKFNLTPKTRILDVGGSMKQHKDLNIDTLVDILRPEESHFNKNKLLAKNFVRLDLNRDKFPFSNNEFDFCLCTHTLEDLPYPFLAIEEMSRVAKAGYIATPAMGKDITFTHFDLNDWKTGARRVPGISHHKWLFVKENGVMQVIPKNYPLLYSSEFHLTKWTGEEEFEYSWKSKIKFKETNDINFSELIETYRSFLKNNKGKYKRGGVLLYLDNPYYFAKEVVKKVLKFYSNPN